MLVLGVPLFLYPDFIKGGNFFQTLSPKVVHNIKNLEMYTQGPGFTIEIQFSS